MCDHCSNQGIENAEKIADTAAAPDEMPKTYDPSSVEERLYKKWEERGYFHSEPNPDKPPYTIVIPRPTSRVSSTWDTHLMKPCRIY